MEFTDHEVSADNLNAVRQRVSGWSARLRAIGLNALAAAFLDAAEPLSPLGAQLLWVAQPTLKLFMPGEEIDGLAQLLDDPAGVAWLRKAMIEPDDPADTKKASL